MHKKDIKYLLDVILMNAFAGMQALEKSITDLNLKRDGTDDPDQLRQGQIYSLILTLMNDTIHPAHDYAKLVFKEAAPQIDRYKDQQKIAFQNKLVNECSCRTCQLSRT